MALQQAITLPGGIALSGAYHRIQGTQSHIPAGAGLAPSLSLEVAVYRDAQARADALPPVYVKPYLLDASYDPLGNLVQQGYLALKALPDYAGALDV